MLLINFDFAPDFGLIHVQVTVLMICDSGSHVFYKLYILIIQ